MLEARGLTKCYASIPAVSDVSFAVKPGEILGYLGPNGSGKSTTVKMITGLMEPTRGEVLFHGANIKDDLLTYKKLLGYVPEEALLYPYLTGWEYLEFVGILRGMDQKLLRFICYRHCGFVIPGIGDITIANQCWPQYMVGRLVQNKIHLKYVHNILIWAIIGLRVRVSLSCFLPRTNRTLSDCGESEIALLL